MVDHADHRCDADPPRRGRLILALQAVQIGGAVLILAAFIAAQRGAWSPRAVPYLVLNVLGAGLLAGAALADGDWGFLLLEGVWTLVSLQGLVQVLRGAGARAGA